MKYFLIISTIAALVACSEIDSNMPSRVKSVDLIILSRANALLASESNWDANTNKQCNSSGKLTLFCALEKSSYDVLGTYAQNNLAIESVRFAINKNFNHRWSEDQLTDFNNHPETTFNDVKFIIADAEKVMKNKFIRQMEGLF